MKENLIAETSMTIDTSTDAVWIAITTPALIKEYLMGTKVTIRGKKI